ncbi:unnamed protein product [Arctogadus glacialis]
MASIQDHIDVCEIPLLPRPRPSPLAAQTSAAVLMRPVLFPVAQLPLLHPSMLPVSSLESQTVLTPENVDQVNHLALSWDLPNLTENNRRLLAQQILHHGTRRKSEEMAIGGVKMITCKNWSVQYLAEQALRSRRRHYPPYPSGALGKGPGGS